METALASTNLSRTSVNVFKVGHALLYAILQTSKHHLTLIQVSLVSTVRRTLTIVLHTLVTKMPRASTTWPDTRVSATQEVVGSSASYRWWMEGGVNGACGEIVRALVVAVNRCAFELVHNPHLERMDSIVWEKT